jgi:hypothetical protein
MGPEQWAMYMADRLKERFEIDIDPYTLGYALMDFADEYGKTVVQKGE